jgi:hypothetical protein
MIVVCTVCSRKKSSAPGLIPARERYLGEHIEQAARDANKRGLKLYFLSGLMGLIPDDCKIPAYDHKLTHEGVDELSRRVKQQLGAYGITAIRFYYKVSDNWLPYLRVLEKATADPKVGLALSVIIDPPQKSGKKRAA